MDATRPRRLVRLLPAAAAVVVAIALAYALTLSSFGSRAAPTVALAGTIVGLVALGAVGLALGNRALAAGVGLVVLAGGFLGFALGPQLWIAGLLLLLSTEIDRPIAPFVLLACLAPLVALTILTSPGDGVAVGTLGVGIYLAALASTLATHVPRWRSPDAIR